MNLPPFSVDREVSQQRLTVLMPHLELARMTGGPNTILTLTGRLAASGIAVQYVAAFGGLDADEGPLREHLAALGGSDAAGSKPALLAATDGGFVVGPREVVLATWWPTAHLANAIVQRTEVREFIYLIQDYEPGFYAWSTNHALALATYDFPCRAIFNERLLRDHFARETVGHFGPQADDRIAIAFDPAVDRRLFRRALPEERPVTGRRLLFYARPRNERNLFDLSLRALRIAVQGGGFDGEPWQFVAIGFDVPQLPLSEQHALRPAGWLPLEDYARLLAGSDLLLSPMLSPHTSYPPLEMATAGNLVVTNTFGAKTAEALASLSPRIRGVRPQLDALADALRAAAEDVGHGQVPSGDVSLPGTWDDALKDVIPWLRRTLAELWGAP